VSLEFTTVVAIDESHIEELRFTWPTWERYRPEILDRPLLLICDGVRSREWWQNSLSFLPHGLSNVITWNPSTPSQREKMLSGLVLAPARHLETPWYLKLDTDTVALSRVAWIDDEWFQPDDHGRQPAFVTSPWCYIKPANAIERLDEWGDSIPELRSYPRLNIRAQPGAQLVKHPRIISWCFFGRTASLQQAAAMCGDRLPVPSHDTFLWYVAKRRGDFFRRVRMKQYGWAHVLGRKRLARICRQALNGEAEASAPDTTRHPPSNDVVAARARIVSTLVPSGGTGALVDVIGQATRNAFERQRTDWTFATWPFGSAYSAAGQVGGPVMMTAALPNSAILDFVVLEGTTQENALVGQIAHWWSTLRPGGILARINYGHPRDRRGTWAISRVIGAFAQSVGAEVILPGHTVWLLSKSTSK
jgi:hypothetical protein